MLLNQPAGVDAFPLFGKRYWRIYVTDTNYPTPGHPADAVAIAEVTWVDRFGASVPKPTGVTVTAGSQYGSEAPSKAYDNNNATFWSGYGPRIPDWIAFDFGSGAEFDFREVSMRARSDSYYTQAPRDFQIQYSNDGATWTTYWSKAGIIWSAGLAQTFYM